MGRGVSLCSGNLLRVENVGVGSALNVCATAVLTYYGYLFSSGDSRPRDIAAGARDELRIVQHQPYGPTTSSSWNVRVTYEDASGFRHWIAVDYGYHARTTTERGNGQLPQRLRLTTEPAWDDGPPTITYSLAKRVQLRLSRAFGEISDWRRLHEVARPANSGRRTIGVVCQAKSAITVSHVSDSTAGRAR